MSPATDTPAAPTVEDLPAEASELRMATFRLARRLRAERAIDAMSDGQFAVLAAFKMHGLHTFGELPEGVRPVHLEGCEHRELPRGVRVPGPHAGHRRPSQGQPLADGCRTRGRRRD